MAAYSDFCESITKQLFEIIDAKGSALKWHKEWDSAGCGQLPVGINGLYHGSNLLMLFGSQYKDGFKSNRWMTFNQIKQQGGFVKKGAKSKTVFFWKFCEAQKVGDDTETDDKKITAIFKTYHVFNVEQSTLNVDVIEAPQFHESAVDALIAKLGITVSHFGGRAYYNRVDDVIVMPHKNKFASNNHYFTTLLHETVHFTGTYNRVPRQCFDEYGVSEKARAQEELIAEIGSVFLSAHFGLKSELENHASYVQSWKTLLSEREIMSAVNTAAKAFDWILKNTISEKEAVAA